MKKLFGALLLVVACTFLLANNGGGNSGAAVGVYDAHGQYLGTLVDTYGPNVYVASLKKVVPFDQTGNVAPAYLYYLTTDCSGTAYGGAAGLMAGLIVFRSGSSLYTITSAGDPLPYPTNSGSYNYGNGCVAASYQIGGGGIGPVTLTPLNQSLPFSLPVAAPLSLH